MYRTSKQFIKTSGKDKRRESQIDKKARDEYKKYENKNARSRIQHPSTFKLFR